MWKKRKDEILKQRLVSEKIKEGEHNAILLMNANQKKKEAEAAFSAWYVKIKKKSFRRFF